MKVVSSVTVGVLVLVDCTVYSIVLLIVSHCRGEREREELKWKASGVELLCNAMLCYGTLSVTVT